MDATTMCLQIWIPYVPRFLLKQFASFFYSLHALVHIFNNFDRLSQPSSVVDGLWSVFACACVNERQFTNNTQLFRVFSQASSSSGSMYWKWVKSELTKCTKSFTALTCSPYLAWLGLAAHGLNTALSEIWRRFLIEIFHSCNFGYEEWCWIGLHRRSHIGSCSAALALLFISCDVIFAEFNYANKRV